MYMYFLYWWHKSTGTSWNKIGCTSSVQSLPLPQEDVCKIINYNCAIKELKKEKMQVYASECVGVCKCAFVDKSTQ